MVGDIVNDKDGVSALAVMAEYAVQLYSQGVTFLGQLDRLYEK